MLSRARDEAREILRALIVNGEVDPGARLEEVELSARLNVSRTPIREALIALEQEGLVQSRPSRGFRVAPLDAALVRETYPVLAALEAEAVRLTGPGLPALASRLREINRRLANEKAKPRQHELDRSFHDALTEGCGNARLLMLREAEWNRAKRFDGAHRRGLANPRGSCAEHDAIIAAAEQGKAAVAADLLADHWRKGIEVVVQWLDETS